MCKKWYIVRFQKEEKSGACGDCTVTSKKRRNRGIVLGPCECRRDGPRAFKHAHALWTAARECARRDVLCALPIYTQYLQVTMYNIRNRLSLL